MPILEFKCHRYGHVTERLYLTFAEAEKAPAWIECPECHYAAPKVEFSVPGPGLFYGEGFYKPAPSGKTQTVGRDVTKYLKEENITSATTADGEKFGVKHMEKAKRISKQIRRSRRQQ